MPRTPTVKLVADREPPVLPRPSVRVATLLSVAAGLWIAIGELDHLVAQVLDQGRSWSPTGLTGPGALLSRTETVEGWRFLGAADVGGWLAAYAVLDVLLVAAYVPLLLLWLRRLSASTRVRRVLFAALVVGALGDVVENVLIALGGALAPVLPFVSTLKWVGLGVAIGGLLVLDRRRWLHGLRLLGGAIYTHRYSAAIVAPLALLGLGRGPDLLEQLPDIQRSWADGDLSGFLGATVVMGILMVAVLVVGRQRTHHLWQRVRRRDDAPSLREPLVAVWLIGPAGVVVVAAAVDLAGGPVSWLRVVLFCSVPVVIGAVSWGLRRAQLPATRPERKVISRERFDAAAGLGDVLVGLLAVIAGLGSVRAFTAVVALGEADLASYALLALGSVTLLVTWPALDALLRWLARIVDYARFSDPRLPERVLALLTPGVITVRQHDDGPMGGIRRQWLGWSTLLVALLATALVALRPLPLAERYGVIAVFQASLGCLAVLVAATVILFQPGGSPRIFWYVKLPFVPVTSLLVAASLFAGLSGGSQDVHGIRTYAGPDANRGAASRPPLVDDPGSVFADWLEVGAGCEQPLDGTSLSVRPLLMYAAEGGGIRAAYWTASAIDRIAGTAPDDTGCRSAFVSSGASGGSVGLSVASVREPGAAASAVEEIAGQEALGAASVGLVLRDTIFAATGVPLPSFGDPASSPTSWSDRGTLIEHAWEQGIGTFDDPFLRARSSGTWDWGPTGPLVVNSTSTTTSCRTLISQVELPGTSRTECAPGQPAAGSTDLVQCTGQLRITTAALLTARFPYVTPSGVVRCGSREQQIVDGGYAENFGIGTLLDLAPRLLSDVRRHNACVLAPSTPDCAGEPAATTLVVPQLVYFDNGTGSDLVENPGGLDLELLVPPLTILEASSALYSARSQLERAQAALATDQIVSADPSVAAAVDDWRGNPVAVIYQETEPSIAAPLGWVLSDTSIASMRRALCDQDPVTDLDAGDPVARTAGSPPPRFGTIDDVLDLVGDTTPCRAASTESASSLERLVLARSGG